jgi:hypothetical protein
LHADEGLSGLKIVEGDIPKAGQGEVLVRVTLRPVNPTDEHSIAGKRPIGPHEVPFIAGNEVRGPLCYDSSPQGRGGDSIQCNGVNCIIIVHHPIPPPSIYARMHAARVLTPTYPQMQENPCAEIGSAAKHCTGFHAKQHFHGSCTHRARQMRASNI